MRQSQEQRLLSSQFETLEEAAIRKNDEEAATAAAVAKIQADKRSELYYDHAEMQFRVGTILQRDLGVAEMDFAKVKTKAETIVVYASIAHAQERVYELASDITVRGFTPKGELEQALLTAEHKMLKSGFLVDLADKQSNNRVNGFMRDAEVSAELERTRNFGLAKNYAHSAFY